MCFMSSACQALSVMQEQNAAQCAEQNGIRKSELMTRIRHTGVNVQQGG